MYAVIRTGGKQYKVEEGDTLQVDHLSVKGNQVTFTPVLVVTDDGKSVYGKKDLRSYNVKAKVIGDAKGDKVTVLKYRPKTGHATKTGHRQLYSLIEITSIGDKAKAEDKKESKEAADTAAEASEAGPPTEAAEAQETSGS